MTGVPTHTPSAPPLALPDAVRWVQNQLEAQGVEHARLKTEELTSAVLGCPRLEIYAGKYTTLSSKQRHDLDRLVGRLCRHEPMQYVTGRTGFMGAELTCDRRALIPRPETEVLVETVFACRPIWGDPAPAIADVGTGSGCIAIALALRYPHARIFGLDISGDALDLAKENGLRCGVGATVKWVAGDLMKEMEPASLNAIVSNPPYIPTDAWRNLPGEIRQHEPRKALDGGPDGLEVLGRLIRQAPAYLKEQGRLFLEIGGAQVEAVCGLMEQQGFHGLQVVKDLCGRDRVVYGQRS